MIDILLTEDTRVAYLPPAVAKEYAADTADTATGFSWCWSRATEKAGV